MLGLREPMPSTLSLAALRLLSWALILLGTAALATGQSERPVPSAVYTCCLSLIRWPCHVMHHAPPDPLPRATSFYTIPEATARVRYQMAEGVQAGCWRWLGWCCGRSRRRCRACYLPPWLATSAPSLRLLCQSLRQMAPSDVGAHGSCQCPVEHLL